jgi:hypothetical protein
VNHLDRDLKRGLGGDEHHTPPTTLGHAGRVVAREPHPAQHVDLKEPPPVLVRDVEKGFRLKDAGVVDEDVGFRRGRDHLGRALRGSDIARC